MNNLIKWKIFSVNMEKRYYKLVPLKNTNEGRCVNCDARYHCGTKRFKCESTSFKHHYKYDIKAERIDKLKKINYNN